MDMLQVICYIMMILSASVLFNIWDNKNFSLNRIKINLIIWSIGLTAWTLNFIYIGIKF